MNRLIIPELPPSVNHQYRNFTTPKGRRMRVLTTEAQRWFDNTVILTNIWRNREGWKTTRQKVIVRLWFFFPSPKRHMDTHNGIKIIMDAFEDGLIYHNDKTALPRIMDYGYDADNPRMEAEFEVVA